MLERILIGVAAEIVLKLVERYMKDGEFRAAVDKAVLKRAQAENREGLLDASKALQDAMAKKPSA